MLKFTKNIKKLALLTGIAVSIASAGVAVNTMNAHADEELVEIIVHPYEEDDKQENNGETTNEDAKEIAWYHKVFNFLLSPFKWILNLFGK